MSGHKTRKLPDDTYRRVRAIVSKEIIDSVSDCEGGPNAVAVIKSAYRRCKAAKLDVTQDEVDRIYHSV